MPAKPAEKNIMSLATKCKMIELKRSQINGVTCLLIVLMYVTWRGLPSIWYLTHGVNGLTLAFFLLAQVFVSLFSAYKETRLYRTEILDNLKVLY